MVYEPIFKKLPFHRILTSVIETTLFGLPQRHSKCLNREFGFTVPEEYKERLCDAKTDQKIEIQLRFCRRLSNLKSCHEIDDYIPPELHICMNGFDPELPPFVDPECKLRRAKPIDITEFCKKASGQNQIVISWFASQNDNYEYFFTIHLVERMSPDDIVNLMDVSVERDSRSIVLESFGGRTRSANSDLSMTSLTVSLLCPLSMQRINVPSRSIYCTHVQCFDVFNYLQINEFKPSWKCPICRDKAPFENLIIDGMFKRILQEKNAANEIEFAADGSWKFSPLPFEKKEARDDSQENQPADIINKSVLNRRKSTGTTRSSPRIQKRRTKIISGTPKASSRGPRTPQSGQRSKQKSTQKYRTSDVIKQIKYRNESIDVTDLTLDSSGEF